MTKIGDMIKRAMTGDIPRSVQEAIIHDIIGTAQGLIPGMPEPAGIVRTGRMLDKESGLSEKAQSSGATMQAIDVLLSAVDPTSISDLLFMESTIWYLLHRNELSKLPGHRDVCELHIGDKTKKWVSDFRKRIGGEK